MENQDKYIKLLWLLDTQQFLVLDDILSNLIIADLISLAATCETLKDYILNNRRIRNLRLSKIFNLDIFPRFITTQDVDAVYNVFPDTEVLKLNLHFARDNILDASLKFMKLRKFCFYLNEDDYNTNIHKSGIDSLTIRCVFSDSDNDTLFRLLDQFSYLKSFSLYNGYLSMDTISLIKEKQLRELKLDNTQIEFMNRGWLIQTMFFQR